MVRADVRERAAGKGGGVQSITRGASTRPRASCIARTWIALSVERMCASCLGCAPKAPFWTTTIVLSADNRQRSSRRGVPASSSQQLITYPIVSSASSASLCFIIHSAVTPQ